jgi:hypothetical protein
LPQQGPGFLQDSLKESTCVTKVLFYFGLWEYLEGKLFAIIRKIRFPDTTREATLGPNTD